MTFAEILNELPNLSAEERRILIEELDKLKSRPRTVTCAELAKRWKPGTHLTPEECDAFSRDIEEGRRFFKPYVSPWD